jgi:calcium-dependent protein kinase
MNLGFLPADTMQKLAFNLISALRHMHENKIIHRDLKPENLLLKSTENNYEIVLADFGLATCLGEEPLFKRCGTPGFVAPEILEYIEG